MIYYDLDDLERARGHLVIGLDLSSQLGMTSGALQAAYTLAHIQHLLGDTAVAQSTADQARRAADRLNHAQAHLLAAAYEADLQLKLGNVDAAARWAQAAGFSPSAEPDVLSEPAYLTFARLLVTQRRTDDAETMLAGLERYTRRSGFDGSLIPVKVLQAQTQHTIGHRQQSLADLDEAVRLAASEGYRRAFLDGGLSVAALLPAVRPTAPAFVDELLAAFPGAAGQAKAVPAAQRLAEPLSERELEVLALVAEGMTNAEIADRLVISVGTVKTHVHNIVGKLGVDSRPRAIARARELGLA